MADTSNRSPDGGWILPNIPSEYIDDPANEQARTAALDAQLEGVRAAFDAFLEAHDVRRASGSDLDNIGALLGVPRLAGEGDTAYRARIPATAQSGIGSITRPAMLAYLNSATNNTPVLVQNAERAGEFKVIFLADPPQGTAVVSLIENACALGMDFGCWIKDTTATYGRLGTFRLGTQTIGAGRSFVLLRAPLVVATGGSLSRLGTFRLGAARLADSSAVSYGQ
jgi:hypothetical protein